MAITATLGGTINNAVAGTTLTFGAVSLSTGQDVVVAVAILDTTKSVSTITDTALNTYTLKSAVNNGSNVRVEIWEAHNITGNASDVILVTLSGATLASAAFEEYAGVASGVGTVGSTATGTSFDPEGDVLTQDGNNWSVAAIGVATLSGDTFTADLGTKRQALIPALTTASVALVDNTTIALATLRNGVLLSASRAWAAVTLELRTGAAAINITPEQIKAPISSGLNMAKHQIVKAPPQDTAIPVYVLSTTITQYIQGEE